MAAVAGVGESETIEGSVGRSFLEGIVGGFSYYEVGKAEEEWARKAFAAQFFGVANHRRGRLSWVMVACFRVRATSRAASLER